MATDTAPKTEVGSYFISNYPPFSLWQREHLPEIQAAFQREPDRSGREEDSHQQGIDHDHADIA